MGKYITAIDFGSSKIAVAVGERTGSGFRIIMYADAPAGNGIRNGEIRNDMKVVNALRPLIQKAAAECGEEITEAVIGISGSFIKSMDVQGEYTRKEPDRFILEDEVRQLAAEQFRQAIAPDEVVFEVIPQKFNVDDQIGLKLDEIVGMIGTRVEGFFKVFYGKRDLIERRRKILEECGVVIKKAVLSPIASATAVLNPQEMENGVVMVDIGKNLTEIAIVKDNIVREIACVPFGGDAVTNDIKSVVNLTYDWSERIKLRHGCCLEEFTPENKQLLLRGEDNVEEGSVELSLLSRIIEARVSEIFDAVAYIIKERGFEGKLPAGAVLTGGSCYLEYILPLARVLLGTKVRLAAPRSSITSDSAIGAMDAYSSTCVGLAIEGLKSRLSYVREAPVRVATTVPEVKPAVQKPAAAETEPAKPKKGGFISSIGRGLFDLMGGAQEEAEAETVEEYDDMPLDEVDAELKAKREAEERARLEAEAARKAQREMEEAEEKKRKEEEKRKKDEAKRKKGAEKIDKLNTFFGDLFGSTNDNA